MQVWYAYNLYKLKYIKITFIILIFPLSPLPFYYSLTVAVAVTVVVEVES